ncbi:MAG: tRNA 2-thiouridine(34) synthase MnmA [Patescibacteria group bacterium]
MPNTKSKLKVALGMSGGVDSSVAGLLLKREGYDVAGVHLQCWDYDNPGCKGREDRADALKVASMLNIKFTELNFEKEYAGMVLDYFWRELKAGRTPNPDIVCNTHIKFGLFLDWATNYGFDYIATGHYARLKTTSGEGTNLLSGVDITKDQSYFLYRVPEEKLKKVLFPLGELEKSEVRKIAKEANLPVFNKKDSTGICFTGNLNVLEFIKSNVTLEKGNVLNVKGEVIGEHDGACLYTIGQRHGFKLNTYLGIPTYVISKDVAKNTITVGFGKDSQKKEFDLTDLVFVNRENTKLFMNSQFDCEIRIRNLGEKMKGRIRIFNDIASVTLEDFALGVASGQSAVFYRKDLVLGGGIIR